MAGGLAKMLKAVGKVERVESNKFTFKSVDKIILGQPGEEAGTTTFLQFKIKEF